MNDIETKVDFIGILKDLGWRPGRDEVGDRNVERRLGDIVIHALVGRRSTRYAGNPSGVLILGLSPWVTTDALSAAYTLMVSPKKRVSDPCIIDQSGSFVIELPVIKREDVVAHSDAVIAWAKSCDIGAGLKALRDLPTNSIGAMPARHLAALAEAGDVETLTRYRDSFAAGDRAGFTCNYITEDYIARALDFAQHRRADRNWLPKRPRLRV